jgi:hypothetical protein
MAKREEIRTNKSKMTVMVFQMEGSDDTLQEGLRRISQAIEGVVKPHHRALSALPSGANSGATAGNGGTANNPEAETDQLDEVESDDRDLQQRRDYFWIGLQGAR